MQNFSALTLLGEKGVVTRIKQEVQGAPSLMRS
ncbi:hypothetical protein EMIT043CA1_100128 [Pseudomonas brassicacearum]